METGTSSLTKRTISPPVNRADVCNVYFCSRPIWLSTIAFSVSSSASGCGASWHKHWSLAFEYGHDQVLICEAVKGSLRQLQGQFTWINKSDFEKTNPNKKKLGRYIIPKLRIDNAVRKMCNSGDYHLTRNNCQNWVLELLRILGIEPPKEERHAEEVVEEFIRPGAAIGASAAMGAAPVLIGLSVVTGGIAFVAVALGATIVGGATLLGAVFLG